MAQVLSEFDDETNDGKGTGRFSFRNGDVYEGGYKIVGDKKTVVRQDYGVYVTGDFHRYHATWNDDKIASDLHIRYNNRTEYKGEIDGKGAMSGEGKYIFPDGSILIATWSQNKPVLNPFLEEPHGSIWKGEFVENELRFTTGNHFWDEMM